MVENQGRFEFLEHTADILIAAHGKNLEEAFESAALAMFEVMTDTAKINSAREDTVEVVAEDEYALLYSWLEALLVKFEVNGMLYSKFKIVSLLDTGEEIKLKATILGEKFDPQKHTQKVAVKAVTYHRMEFIKEHESVTVEFILDI
jgi:SHS2 domain-containing protein